MERKHHEVAGIFPMMTDEEYESLKADIAANGLLEPVWLHPDDHSIIDGRNRHKACVELGKEPKYRYWDGKGSLVSFVVSLNLKRRHLNESQRGMVADKIATMKQGERTDLKPSENFPKVSQAEAAAMMNVSDKTARFARTVRSTGTPELIAAVESGKVAVSAAAKIAQAPKPEQVVIVAQGPKAVVKAAKKIQREKQFEKKVLIQQKQQEVKVAHAASIKESPVVYQTDALELLRRYDDCHFDLLFTDPPYATDVDDIAAFAAEWVPLALSKVKQTGRAYICTGAYPGEMKAYLDVFAAQDKFTVDNPLIWTYRNTLGVTPKMKYNLNYQLVWHLYGKESRELDTSITNEMFSVQDINAPDGRQFNRFHAWQKPDELARRIITHATRPGDLIVDPFTCTGTFVLMSAKLGRKAVGADISKDALGIAKERGCDVVYS